MNGADTNERFTKVYFIAWLRQAFVVLRIVVLPLVAPHPDAKPVSAMKQNEVLPQQAGLFSVV
jgi:hypothetical protein